MQLLQQWWQGRRITIVFDESSQEVSGAMCAVLSTATGSNIVRACVLSASMTNEAGSSVEQLMRRQWSLQPTAPSMHGTSVLEIDEATPRLRLLGGGCKQSSQLKDPSSAPSYVHLRSKQQLVQAAASSSHNGGNVLSVPQRPVRSTPRGPIANTPQQPPQQLNPYELSTSDDDGVIGEVESFGGAAASSDQLSEVDVLSAASGKSGRSLASSFRSANSSRSGGGGGVLRRGSSALSVGSRTSRASRASRSSRGAASDAKSEVLSAASGGHSEKTLQRLIVDRSKELGRGGYGTVYRATDQRTRRQYAVKEVLFDERNVAMVETLRAEFTVLGKIRHPHIIRVYNFVVEDHGVARIIMELAPNGSVRSVAKQMGGKLSERGAKRVIYQSLLGLHYLHTHGILHRDVKPDNMLMDKDGVVKLSDFGTCRLTMHVASGTATKVVGTVSYMSPESITGTFSMGSDLWGLAASFVELVSGKPPWHETGINQHVQLLFHIGSAKPPKHHPQFPPNLSPEAIEFLTACFQSDVRQRPSAAQLLLLPFFLSAAADLAEVGSRPNTSPAESRPSHKLQPPPPNTPSKINAQTVAADANTSTMSTTNGGSRRQTHQLQHTTTASSAATGSGSVHTPRSNPIRSIPEFFAESGTLRQQAPSSINSKPSSPGPIGGAAESTRGSLRLSSLPQQHHAPTRASSSDSFVSWHSVESVDAPPPQQQQQQQSTPLAGKPKNASSSTATPFRSPAGAATSSSHDRKPNDGLRLSR